MELTSEDKKLNSCELYWTEHVISTVNIAIAIYQGPVL